MIDTTNKFLVAAGAGDRVVILAPPRTAITYADALLFAAWLVAVAQQQPGEFEAVLQAVNES